MTALYGTPEVRALTANNSLFLSDFNPENAPKFLLKKIIYCQEVAILGDVM
jgi:hypothetical protein